MMPRSLRLLSWTKSRFFASVCRPMGCLCLLLPEVVSATELQRPSFDDLHLDRQRIRRSGDVWRRQHVHKKITTVRIGPDTFVSSVKMYVVLDLFIS